MTCSLCGGYVEWKGPLTALTHTECAGCGGINCQEVEESEFQDFDDDEDEYCNRCSNMGVINCYCGGDLCCCENHGEMECPDCSY